MGRKTGFFKRIKWTIKGGALSVKLRHKSRPGQSARGLAHSKTLRDLVNSDQRASVLEIAGPLALSEPDRAFVPLRQGS